MDGDQEVGYLGFVTESEFLRGIMVEEADERDKGQEEG